MLGIFCYIENSTNVLLPYFVVGVKLAEERREWVSECFNEIEDLDTLSLKQLLKLFHFIKIRIVVQKRYSVDRYANFYIRELGKFEVEKYGLESAFYRQVNYLANLDKEVLVSCYNSNFTNHSPKVTYIDNYLGYPELTLAYILSKIYREYYKETYITHYPKLNLREHKGELNKLHLAELIKLKSLPYFYNESLLLDYILKNRKRLPKWTKSYIERDDTTK